MFTRLLTSAAVGLAMTFAAGAANAVTFDLQSGGDTGVLTSGFGNTLTITDSGRTLVVTSMGENNSDRFNSAQLGRYSSGVGVCNQNEGLNCSSNYHTMDNGGTDDWILFIFDQVATIDSVFLSAFGDTDVDYFVGTATLVSSSLYGVLSEINGTNSMNDIAGITGLGRYTSSGSSSDRTVAINQVGNFLLIGARETDDNDYIKIKNIKATFSNVVPEPATWGLMIAGFAGLGFATRRRTVTA